jgi:mannose-6-phosphate isomerase-like protein (cupin superfamily)
MGMKTTYSAITPYITRDGSEIRELMHPTTHGNVQQSLAEATITPGSATRLHRHHHSEEIYYIVAGDGLMTLGHECFPIAQGDTICIPPGTPHCVENRGVAPLRILCSCAPAYSHTDTELLADADPV